MVFKNKYRLYNEITIMLAGVSLGGLLCVNDALYKYIFLMFEMLFIILNILFFINRKKI